MRLDELHSKQPKARKKRVWDTDEHLGKHKSRWHNKYVSKAKPYGWSKTGTYHGQSEGYKDHII